MYTYDREEGVGEFLICIYRIKVEEQEPWAGFEPTVQPTAWASYSGEETDSLDHSAVSATGHLL